MTQIGGTVQECCLILEIHCLGKPWSIARIARNMTTSTVQNGPVWYGTVKMAACTNSAAKYRSHVEQRMYTKPFKPIYLSN